MTVPRADANLAQRVKKLEDQVKRIKLMPSVSQAAVAPLAVAKSSVWYDTSAGNQPSYWNGQAWVPVRDETIAVAQTTADTAQSTATTAASDASAAVSTANAAASDASTALGKFPITATDITDGAISTPKLAADAIDGMVITGSVFRTAVPANPRIEIGDDTGTAGADPTSYRIYSGLASETFPAGLYGVVPTPSQGLLAIRGFDAFARVGAKLSMRTTASGGAAELDGDEFSVFTPVSFFTGDVDVTGALTKGGVAVATTSAAQALTNKDLTDGTNTFPASLLTATGTQTVTNKDLSSATNTLPANPQPVVSSSATSISGITGTTFAAGTPVVGAAFTAPKTGSVYITVTGHLEQTVAARFGYLAFELRTGNVVGSGTITHGAVTQEGVGVATSRVSASNRTLITGLTPGNSYNAQTMHVATPSGSTVNIFYRSILVEPVL